MRNILKSKKNKVILIGYLLYITTPLVYAEEDPISIINNLSDLIFQLITAIGGIILGMSIFQFGMSFKSHDPSQRSNGIIGILGGIIMVCSKVIVKYITR